MPSGIQYFPVGHIGRIGSPLNNGGESMNLGFTPHTITAVSTETWLVITSVGPPGPSGFTYNIPVSGTWLGAGPRTAYVIITDTVDGTYSGYWTYQQNGCANYALDRFSDSVSYGGVTGSPLFVLMSQGGFEAPASWTATIDVPWITLTPTSGNYAAGTSTGGHDPSSQLTHYDVAPNTGTTVRVGHITIHGAFSCGPDPVLTITQAAAPGGGGGGGGGTPGSDVKNPFNLAERWGYYLRAGIATTGILGVGNAVCLRANKVAPFGNFDQFGLISPIAGAIDPRIAYTPDTRRLLATYRYNGDTYIARSDDDGHTWGGNVILIAGGKHPTIAAGIDGTLIAAAYIAPTGSATYGTIQVAVQGPGDAAFAAPFTLKDQTGANVIVADDSFHLCQPPNGARLWVWALMFGGEGGCSEWTSGEPDSKSVTRVV